MIQPSIPLHFSGNQSEGETALVIEQKVSLSSEIKMWSDKTTKKKPKCRERFPFSNFRTKPIPKKDTYIVCPFIIISSAAWMQGQRFLLLLVCLAAVSYGSKISPRVAHLLAQEGQSTRDAKDGDVNLWVYFSDKDLQVGFEEIRGQLRPNAIARRRKVLASDAIVDYRDFPVNPNYISQLVASGVVMRRASKWLNAVSKKF
jgi:hypothetical protein